VVPAPLAIASFEGDHGMVGRALVRLFNERVLLGAFSWALAASSGKGSDLDIERLYVQSIRALTFFFRMSLIVQAHIVQIGCMGKSFR
jgi:hypothetical protein